MCNWKKNCINIVTKEKSFGLIGGISLPKKNEVDKYFDFMINQHKKINPEIEILEKYIGIKNEVSQKKENRNYLYHIKPNVYVVSASNDQGNNLFIYYEYSGKSSEEVDIRYIREKGRRLCDIYLDSMMVLNYAEKEHPYNKRLGKEFSVYQEIYILDDSIIDEYISQDEFPSLEKILVKDSLKGYKLKYNVNDTFYYMGNDSILPEVCIQRIYPYQLFHVYYEYH